MDACSPDRRSDTPSSRAASAECSPLSTAEPRNSDKDCSPVGSRVILPMINETTMAASRIGVQITIFRAYFIFYPPDPSTPYQCRLNAGDLHLSVSMHLLLRQGSHMDQPSSTCSIPTTRGGEVKTEFCRCSVGCKYADTSKKISRSLFATRQRQRPNANKTHERHSCAAIPCARRGLGACHGWPEAPSPDVGPPWMAGELERARDGRARMARASRKRLFRIQPPRPAQDMAQSEAIPKKAKPPTRGNSVPS